MTTKLTTPQRALLTKTAAGMKRAGVSVRIAEDHLSIPDTDLIVRVMEDPGHPDRVHLRSVTAAGEVTVSTQREQALGKLVQYAFVLVASAKRKAEK